nr:ThuA domain-containing protein [Pyrinomonadaceae bacterium]
ILAKRGQQTVIKEVDGKTKVEVVGSTGNPDEIQSAIKPEDWNEYVIIAKGNHLTHIINGRKTVDVIDEQKTKAAASGVLALQLHAGEPMTVRFRDIRMKPLKSVEQTGTNSPAGGKKKIVMVAGTPSHGPGDHEFNAGVLLLKQSLDQVPGVLATAHLNGWPKQANAFDGADTIMLFMDGGKNHPVVRDDHLKIIGDLMKKGVGLVAVHYAVEVPKDKGGPEFLEWLGGYYEDRFSTNPHWVADIKSLPEHPITRGVKPFAVDDEWYFNMRFRPQMKGVTPILVAKPSDETRQGKSSSPRGPYPHIVAASGRDEVLAWAVERPDGGRGFSLTGAHNHENWGDANFRKVILNALLWTAKAEVPPDGVASTVTEENLKKNLDPKPPRRNPAADTNNPATGVK